MKLEIALTALVVASAAGCNKAPESSQTSASNQAPAMRSMTATMHMISVDGIGAEAGTITVAETKDGVMVTPNLHGFRPGLHAFHAHENPDCGPAMQDGKMDAGRAAGPHYNGPAGQAAAAPAATAPAAPATTSMPEGMKMDGMKMDGMDMSPAAATVMQMRGNMPELTAAADGTITKPVSKSGLMYDELLNRSFVIHPYGEAGSDPERPKDDSASIRIACAVLPK